MKSYEFFGKSVEKAIEDGLKQIGKNHEDVDIKIISNGGLFKKAKVEIIVSEENDIEEIATNLEKTVGKAVNNNLITPKQNHQEVCNLSNEQTANKNCKCEDNCECNKEDDNNKECNKNESDEQVKVAKKSKDQSEYVSYAKNFVEGLCKTMNIDVEVANEETEEAIKLTLNGENSSKLIGYRGECLNAIQYLTNITASKNVFKGKRIFVDVENYREKREKALCELADRIATKVMRTGHPQKLEPMKPYERRIIHTHLQENGNVYTQSSGEEPRRFLTVYPRGYEEKK